VTIKQLAEIIADVVGYDRILIGMQQNQMELQEKY
jgi:hypothetical protein